MIPESKIKSAIKDVAKGLGIPLHGEPTVCTTTLYLHDRVLHKYQVEFTEVLTPVEAKNLYATKS